MRINRTRGPVVSGQALQLAPLSIFRLTLRAGRVNWGNAALGVYRLCGVAGSVALYKMVINGAPQPVSIEL